MTPAEYRAKYGNLKNVAQKLNIKARSWADLFAKVEHLNVELPDITDVAYQFQNTTNIPAIPKQTSTSEILLYQTEDGQMKLEVRLEAETLWLTQQQMATLLQTTKQNIGRHLKNIFAEEELNEESTVKDFFTVASNGKTYQMHFYNLDAIISVGYRIKSRIATRFRQWATQRLREFIIKGFTIDDERLQRPEQTNYFEELLARIRNIRSSEKVFWRKVLNIYATSIDYDPKAEVTQRFFAILQNKMHWAAHGHTAAEIIVQRADAQQTNMGLTTWNGETICFIH